MRLINADRLLTERAKSTYYHLPNGDTAIPIIDIEHAPTIVEISCEEDGPMLMYLPEGWQRDPIGKIILFYDDGEAKEYREERKDGGKQMGI